MSISLGIQTELNRLGWKVDACEDGYTYIMLDDTVIGASEHGLISAMIDAKRQTNA